MITFLLVNPEREVSSIAILVLYKGVKYRKGIGESIPVYQWNRNKKRAKVNSTFMRGKLINDVIDNWEAAVIEAISKLKDTYSLPSRDEFFDMVEKCYFKEEIFCNQITFCNYMSFYVERYNSVRPITTIKKYITARNKLSEYEIAIKRSLYFKDINISFYNSFQEWFYAQGFSDNYFGNIIKVIKQVYREARMVDKLHNFDEISHYNFVTTHKESDNIYLTQDELTRIHRLDLTDSEIAKHYQDLSPRCLKSKAKSLTFVRDRFLIGAYTGLRVSDFGRINEMHFGKFIRVKTSKTGADVVIPIHPIIRDILDNGFDGSVTVSDQKINQHIKEIAKIAQINDTIVLNKHVSGKVVEIVKKKYELVCTHTARRSFATNAYKAGVPTIAIMKITGHKKESTFLKYIKVSNEENAELLSAHSFFNL